MSQPTWSWGGNKSWPRVSEPPGRQTTHPRPSWTSWRSNRVPVPKTHQLAYNFHDNENLLRLYSFPKMGKNPPSGQSFFCLLLSPRPLHQCPSDQVPSLRGQPGTGGLKFVRPPRAKHFGTMFPCKVRFPLFSYKQLLSSFSYEFELSNYHQSFRFQMIYDTLVENEAPRGVHSHRSGKLFNKCFCFLQLALNRKGPFLRDNLQSAMDPQQNTVIFHLLIVSWKEKSYLLAGKAFKALCFWRSTFLNVNASDEVPRIIHGVRHLWIPDETKLCQTGSPWEWVRK